MVLIRPVHPHTIMTHIVVNTESGMSVLRYISHIHIEDYLKNSTK